MIGTNITLIHTHTAQCAQALLAAQLNQTFFRCVADGAGLRRSKIDIDAIRRCFHHSASFLLYTIWE